MTVNVAARMAQKRIVKDINGQIIDLRDETDGGWIIRNRQVVNPKKYEELVQKEKDKQEAAKAASMQITNPKAPDRNVIPGNKSTAQIDKVGDLEKKIDAVAKDVNEKFDSILKILSNKDNA